MFPCAEGSDSREMKQSNLEFISRMRNNNYCVDTTVHPIQNKGLTPKGVLNHYSHRLSPFEKKEILKYTEIHCLPMNDTKIKAPENAVETDFFKWFYPLAVGDHIDYWWTIDKILGKGKCGVVGAATEGKTRKKMAIKVMYKGAPKIYADCMTLMKIQAIDKDGSSNCVHMIDYSCFRGFHYIVMDLYDTDLKKYMNEHHPEGLSVERIGVMTRSIVRALIFLKQNGIVHADIQPSNILMNLATPNTLKLGGFGLSRKIINAVDPAFCQDRSYRAPEVFVYGHQTPAIDMWSFGCVIAEMTNNKVFLQGENVSDQFFVIQEILGIPGKEFLKEFKAGDFFYSSFTDPTPNHIVFRNGREHIDHGFCRAAKHRQVPGARPLRSLFVKKEEKDLQDFMHRTLKWMPKTRLTPEKALMHPFFTLNRTGMPYTMRD